MASGAAEAVPDAWARCRRAHRGTRPFTARAPAAQAHGAAVQRLLVFPAFAQVITFPRVNPQLTASCATVRAHGVVARCSGDICHRSTPPHHRDARVVRDLAVPAPGHVRAVERAGAALGIEGEDVGSITDAGSVALLHGSASGLTGAGAQVFHQNTAGVPGVAEENDEFGATTALLDVNGDGHRDLAAASTAENASNGAVWLLRGTASDLTTKSALAFGPKDLSAPYTNALFGHFLR